MKIDLGMISEALEDHSEMVWYLDKTTGDVFPVSDDLDEELDELGGNPENNPDRFLVIDALDSHDAFRIMEDFVDTLEKGEASRSLLRALDGPKPFASFKHTLRDFPEVREAWFKFEDERMLEHAREFLSVNEIEFEESAS